MERNLFHWLSFIQQTDTFCLKSVQRNVKKTIDVVYPKNEFRFTVLSNVSDEIIKIFRFEVVKM